MSSDRPGRAPRGAAFFDLDRTLVDVNSGLLFAKSEYRKGRIGPMMLLKTLFWGLLYHLSLADIERMFSAILGAHRGLSSELLRQRIRAWFFEEVIHRTTRHY